MSPSSTFKDRTDAGKQLATSLTEYAGTNAIVLAIPRGGVILGKAVASALKLPLDIIVTRKIGAPGDNEYAIGAIDIDGDGIWNEKEIVTIDKGWLKEKITEEKKEVVRRVALYRGTRRPLEIKGKTAIIVDDGIATGLTIKAAILYAKKMDAEKVIVASPVSSPETAHALAQIAEVKVLVTPPLFFSVGQFYQNFPQVSDEEVTSILNSIY